MMIPYKWAKVAQTTYSTFEDWITALSAATTTIGPDAIASIAIGRDVTLLASPFAIPSNIEIKDFYNGAKISGTSTLTIGRMSAKPLHQIFGDSLTVQFADRSCYDFYPEWWGCRPRSEDDLYTLGVLDPIKVAAIAAEQSGRMQRCVNAVIMGTTLHLGAAGDGRYWIGGIVVTGKVFKMVGTGMNRCTIASLTDVADVWTFDCSSGARLGLWCEGFDISYYGLPIRTSGGITGHFAVHNGLVLKNCVEPVLHKVHAGDSNKGILVTQSGGYAGTIFDIDGCVFGSSNNIGLSLELQDNEFGRVRGSWFDENLNKAIYCNSKNVIIENNHFDENGVIHVHLDVGADECVVQGNAFARGGVIAATSPTPGTVLAVSCSGTRCLIQGNLIERHGSANADVLLGADSSGCICQNNYTDERVNANDRISDTSTTAKVLTDDGGTWTAGGNISTTIWTPHTPTIPETTTVNFDTSKDLTLQKFADAVKFFNGVYRNFAYGTLAGGQFSQGQTITVKRNILVYGGLAGGNFVAGNTISKTGGGWTATVTTVNAASHLLGYTITSGSISPGDAFNNSAGVSAVVTTATALVTQGTIYCIYNNYYGTAVNGSRLAYEEIDTNIVPGDQISSGGVTAFCTTTVVSPTIVKDAIYNPIFHTIRITPIEGQMYSCPAGGSDPLLPIRMQFSNFAGPGFSPGDPISKTGGGWTATLDRIDELTNQANYTVTSGIPVNGDAFNNGAGSSAKIVSTSVNNPITVILTGITGTMQFVNYSQPSSTTATVRNARANLIGISYDNRVRYANRSDEGISPGFFVETLGAEGINCQGVPVVGPRVINSDLQYLYGAGHDTALVNAIRAVILAHGLGEPS